jgi:hypothetical protein
VEQASTALVLEAVERALEVVLDPGQHYPSTLRLGRGVPGEPGAKELWVDDLRSGQVLIGVVRRSEDAAVLELRDVGAAPTLGRSSAGGMDLRVVPARVLDSSELLADVLVTTRDQVQARSRAVARRKTPW